MKINDNKRKRLRVSFGTQVQMKFETINVILTAKMKNISMNGIFIETDKIIPLNTPCAIEVIIRAPHSKLTIETVGFVSRHAPTGLGVKFKNNMEWFAFFSIFEHYGKDHKKSQKTNTTNHHE
jgi:hypothetical protein